MKYPKIYLAMDTCFALKRWVEPETWGKLIADMGYQSIQLSTDNELDPIFTSEAHRRNWIKRLHAVEDKYGVKAESIYSGYQTYRTCGFCSNDQVEVRRLVDEWMKPAIHMTEDLSCDLGFSLHCLDEEQMADPKLYQETHEKLYKVYSEIGAYAKLFGGHYVCVEAMYVPRQTPWTIEGTKDFLKNIYAIDSNPIYTTVDVGHMIGQRKFRKPTEDMIRESLEKADKEKPYCSLWLGPDELFRLWEDAVKTGKDAKETAKRIAEGMERYPYQFSTDERDDDPFAWTEELACYSPIMHLQQTDGFTGGHKPFSKENNDKGIIDGKKLLKAMAKSYEQDIEGMPPKAERITLGLELFTSNMDRPMDIVRVMKETCDYWRQFIPKDGMSLDEILKRL